MSRCALVGSQDGTRAARSLGKTNASAGSFCLSQRMRHLVEQMPPPPLLHNTFAACVRAREKDKQSETRVCECVCVRECVGSICKLVGSVCVWGGWDDELPPDGLVCNYIDVLCLGLWRRILLHGGERTNLPEQRGRRPSFSRNKKKKKKIC